MKASDIFICSGDLEYIKEISESSGVDYTEAPINPPTSNVTNDIIRYIITESIRNHETISGYTKDILIDKVYTNCLDSGIDIDPEDDRFPESEHQDIRDLVDMF